jgi:hypothetical protein
VISGFSLREIIDELKIRQLGKGPDMFMEYRQFLIAALVVTGWGAQAQGTAFNYQGHLKFGEGAATGAYDFSFSIWTDATAGSRLGNVVTNVATAVSHGVFTATVDFGQVFDGSSRWLEIGVRTNGGDEFSLLSPRQLLLPTPYAVYAGGVRATGITGTISAQNIGPGTITSNMLAPGAAEGNLLSGGVGPFPNGALVMSCEASSTNLLSGGYVRTGGPINMAWQQLADSVISSTRWNHSAVWTGRKMLVWGGEIIGAVFNTGSAYDPTANTTAPITTNNAPSGRTAHTAVWTGSEMIIWGGFGSDYLGDGGRYSPTTDSWSALSTNNAPAARRYHSGVWTGTEMIIWGGDCSGDILTNSGARYSPATDIWTTISTTNAPAPRILHSAVWTGKEMIVWGGQSGASVWLNDGARYNPKTDTWITMSGTGAPAARAYHCGIWTGTELMVWGGQGNSIFNDGARYDPATDTWVPVTNPGALTARYGFTGVWTGKEMIVWGGCTGSSWINSGARYSPSEDRWLSLSRSGAPEARQGNSAVWAGTEMIIVGGYGNAQFSDTYSYAPPRIFYLYQKQ